jgi:NitT/TauT family transport system permease protein
VRSRFAIVVASIACVSLAWHLVARATGPLLLATPGAVAWSLVADRTLLMPALLHTALGAVGGLAAACLVGVGSAVAAWASRTAALALLPWTVLVQVVPIVAIAPLLVVFLGYGGGVALVTAAIASFYPLNAATATGLAAPTASMVDLFRLYGASRARELVWLRLPAALPAMFAGLRTAAGLAVIGAIVGEFVGSNGQPPTLGYLVMLAARSARSDLGFAAVTCATGLALALHGAVRLAERRAIGRWYGTAA